MSTVRGRMLNVSCVLALLANGSVASAAGQQQDKAAPPPEQNILIERERFEVGPPPDGLLTFQIEVPAGAPDAASGFNFISSEMSFDGKIVKGAPYSADAITETVQMLGDGNRITHKTTATINRDSDGRTRREQTLSGIGPWATSDEPPRTIFINDPVAGVNYILDPRTHIARKGSRFVYFNNAGVSGRKIEQVIERKIEQGVEPRAPGLPPLPGGVAPLPDAPKLGRPIKEVQPLYPPVAKAAGAQGPVRVGIVINEAGEVASAKAVSGHPLLQQSAVEAAQQWRFEPTEIDGKPVKVKGTVSFNFVLPPKENGAQPSPPIDAAVAPAASRLPPPPQEVKESLGKQQIEGVEAEGTRTTVTIPAGAVGNERPIQIVSERWYAPELQTVVMTRRNDPRFGETTYRLTNINRSEPAHALFEVPADYTLKENKSFPRVPRPPRP